MFKRIISLLLAVVLLFSSVAILGACSSENKNNNEKITVGEWLTAVNEKFGMKEALNKTPYFKNIDKDNPYFAAVQIAAEWNVVDPNEKLDVDAPLKWKQALVTLVNVGNFVDNDEPEEIKIEYACNNFDNNIRKYWLKRDIDRNRALSLLDTAFSQWTQADFGEEHIEYDVKEGVKDFTKDDSPVKDYGLNRKGELIFINSSGVEIKAGDILLLPKSRYFRNITTHKVVSVRSDDKYIYVTTTQSEIIAQANKNNSGNTTNVSKENTYDVAEKYIYDTAKKYDVSFLENAGTDSGLHAEDVTVPPNLQNGDLTIDEVFENLNVTETTVSKEDNTVITDSNSQVIYDGGNTSAMSAHHGGVNSDAPLYGCDGLAIGEVDTDGFRKINIKKVNGFKIDMSVRFKPNVEIKINIGKVLGESANGAEKTLFFEFTIKDVSVPIDFDVAWGKVNKAGVKVNFKTEASFGISKGKDVIKFAVAPPKNSGKFLNNLKDLALKNLKDQSKPHGAETIKIGQVNLYSAGIFTACLDIRIVIDVEGHVQITISSQNCIGVEYKDGAGLRFPCSLDFNKPEIEAEVKGEFKISAGPSLYVAGLKERVIGLSANAGVGCKLDATVTVRDEMWHMLETCVFGSVDMGPFRSAPSTPLVLPPDFVVKEYIMSIAQERGATYNGNATNLFTDVCLDVKLYGILSAGLSTDSYIVKKIDKLSEMKLNVTLKDSQNGTFVHAHVDNFDFAHAIIKMGDANEDLCTLKYKDFDDEKPKETQANDENKKDNDKNNSSDEIEKVDEGGRVKGIVFKINTLKTELEPSEKFQIKVTRMPKKYDLKDVAYSSSNKNVAKVDKNGLIEAVAPGNALITAKIKGTEYQAVMAVTVLSNETVAFEGIALNT